MYIKEVNRKEGDKKNGRTTVTFRASEKKEEMLKEERLRTDTIKDPVLEELHEKEGPH